MSFALKPALSQSPGAQSNQSGTSPKSMMSNPQPNLLGQIISQNATHQSNNVAHHGAQNMIMSTHNNSGAGYKLANSAGALSLVQDKTENHTGAANQPLELTRTPEKNEAVQSNGTSESPKLIAQAQAKEEEKIVTPIKIATIESVVTPAAAENESKPDDLSKSPVKIIEAAVSEENQELLKPSEEALAPAPAPITVEASEEKPTIATIDKIDNTVAPIESAPIPNISDSKIDEPKEPEKKLEEVVNVEPKIAEETPSAAPLAKEETTPAPPIETAAPIEPEPAKPDEKTPIETPTAAVPVTPTAKNTPDEAKTEVKTPETPVSRHSAKKVEVKPKSTLKLATVPPNHARKRRSDAKPPKSPTESQPSPAKKVSQTATPKQKPTTASSATPSTPGEGRLSRRNRTQVQPYQSPTPELAIATKLSATHGRSTPTKQNDDKLILFYKNEYLAVRNAEGGFYVCQALQNVYRNTSRKIKIRWLSQKTDLDSSGETYMPDFYDTTDIECVLTTLSLSKSSTANGAQRLSPQEESRAKSILERAIKAEKSGVRPEAMELSEEHPDGLDLSLYKDESQLDKKKEAKKRSRSKSAADAEDPLELDSDPLLQIPRASSPKRARKTPKKKGKTPEKTQTPSPAAKSPPKKAGSAKKGKKSSGRPPVSSKAALPTPPSKVGMIQRIYKNTATATIVSPAPAKSAKKGKAVSKEDTPKAKPTKTPKKTPATPKSVPMQAIPSTSTGKATRTPRKPPSKK